MLQLVSTSMHPSPRLYVSAISLVCIDVFSPNLSLVHQKIKGQGHIIVAVASNTR